MASISISPAYSGQSSGSSTTELPQVHTVSATAPDPASVALGSTWTDSTTGISYVLQDDEGTKIWLDD